MTRAALLALFLGLAASCGSEQPAPAAAEPGKRIPWTTSKVAGSPDPPLPFQAARAFPKLNFRNPLYLAFEPGTGRALLSLQHNKILSFPNDPAAEKTDVFLELKGMWF